VTVSRTIPDSTLAGLALGRYALNGGVIRWAAGTPQAGQIVAHLLPAAAAAAPLITGAGIVTSTSAPMLWRSLPGKTLDIASGALLGPVLLQLQDEMYDLCVRIQDQQNR